MPWQCGSMHGQFVYYSSVKLVHVGFRGWSWWRLLTRSLPQMSHMNRCINWYIYKDNGERICKTQKEHKYLIGID